MGFLNRTGAEIGYYFDKKCNKIFIIEKIQKTPKVPSSVPNRLNSMKGIPYQPAF